MNGPRDTVEYPPPDPERVERALRALRARRAKLRRARMIGGAGALAVMVAVSGAVYAAASSPGHGHRLRVEGGSSTTAATATTSTPSTPSTTTTTPASTTSTTAPEAGTQQITYEPFTESGAIDPKLHVGATATGTCLNGESIRSYRCFGGAGGIYDPCFHGPSGIAEPLVCPNDPLSHDVTAFTATSLTSVGKTTVVRPWAIELANGQICQFVSAALDGLGPYPCTTNNGPTTVADCREPQAASPWWTAECQRRQTQTSPLASYRVNVVWT